MTKDEAIAQIQAYGIELDKIDIDELKSATEAQLKEQVAEWLKVVQPAARNDLFTKIVKILQQVPEWVQVALKIAAALGVVA